MYRLLAYRSTEFMNSAEKPRGAESGSYYSVIIGKNGSGKSRLLGKIATELCLQKDSNGNIKHLEEVPPARVLALSNNVMDRFRFEKNSSGWYYYLGLREASNFMSSGSVLTSIGEYGAQVMTEDPSKVKLEALLEYLELPRLGFAIDRRSLMRISKQAKKESDGYQRKIHDKLKDSLSRHHNVVADENTILIIAEQTQELVDNLDSEIPTPDAIKFMSQLSSRSRLPVAPLIDVLKSVYGLRVLAKFGTDNFVPSAGQALLLSMALRISATIVPNSLVLIDEPEVGLHPEWQSGFIGLLNSILPLNSGCHFIIATHSPHLMGDATNVLVPSHDEGFMEFPIDHRAMSIESIIYRVFGARVVGSSSAEIDLTKVLTWLSQSEQFTPPPEIELAVGSLEEIANVGTPTLNGVLKQFHERAKGGGVEAS